MNYSALIPTEEWLRKMALSLESSIIENKILINPIHGRGFFQVLSLEEGIDLVLTDITLNKDINIQRQKSDNKGIIIKCLIQTPTSFLVVKNKDERQIIMDGIYVSTSHSFDTNCIKSGYQFQVLSYHLSFDWIQKHHRDNSFILNNNTIEHPFFVFEKSNPAVLQLAKNLFQAIYSNSPYKEMLFKTSAIELLTKILSLFDYRRNSSPKDIIKSQQDIEILFQVREKLITTYEEGCPTIQSLSDDFGISPTKLKTNFRIFFGKPIFQYFQQERMELAKKLIESGNYTISEAGFKIGYSNLSKFSSAYKKQFGYNPKETTASRYA